MSYEITLMVLIGAALHAGWNALMKTESDSLLNTTLIMTGGAFIAAFILPVVAFPLQACWPYLAASVAIHIVYFIFLALAYKWGDMSLVYPLMRGIPPVITAIGAMLLFQETFSWKGWTGVFLVSGGSLLLTADSRLSRFFKPAPIIFALLNALVIVLYTLVDGQGARLSGNAFSYTGWMLFLTAVFFFVSVMILKGPQILYRVAGEWRKSLLGGACTFVSYSIALWAMTLAPIALVAALRETSILFGAALAFFTLKERISGVRFAAIALIAAGAIAIKMS